MSVWDILSFNIYAMGQEEYHIKVGGSSEKDHSYNLTNKKPSLMETIFGKETTYEVNYDSMGEIIKKCFKKNWEDVEVSFDNSVIDDERGNGKVVKTSICITKDSDLLGVDTKAKQELSMLDLRQLINLHLQWEWKELANLKNNATAIITRYDRLWDEYRIMGETFTIVVKKKNISI